MLPLLTKWQVLSSSNKRALKTHFPSLAAVFDLNGKIISKSDQSELFTWQVADKPYFVKRYICSKGLASWIGWSRLRLEVNNQRWFNEIGVPAAQVAVYGEQYFLLKTWRGVLITEGIKDVTELSAICKDAPDQFHNAHWRNQILCQLADIVATLHRHRFCHNDLHWRNILVRQTLSGEPAVYLIDCPRGKKFTWPLLRYRKCKDLASLDKLAPNYLSRTQRLRFFLRYAGVITLTEKDKDMIRTVLLHKKRRIKRKLKQKRYLI